MKADERQHIFSEDTMTEREEKRREKVGLFLILVALFGWLPLWMMLGARWWNDPLYFWLSFAITQVGLWGTLWGANKLVW